MAASDHPGAQDAVPATTWDGLPVSAEPPFGATIVVFSRTIQGATFLLLHRAHHGAAYEGDWAWTPPAGARFPGELIEECAQRELLEETNLRLAAQAMESPGESWALYYAEASANDRVELLDSEHDRFEWVPLEVALQRCLPEVVAQGLERVATFLSL